MMSWDSENGNSPRETVKSCHCLMISISQGHFIQVYLHSIYLSFSFCTVEQYVKNEREKTEVDLNLDEIWTQRKTRMNIMSSFPLAKSSSVKYCYFSQIICQNCIKNILQTITSVNVKLIICCLLTCKLKIITMCSVLNHSFLTFHI